MTVDASCVATSLAAAEDNTSAENSFSQKLSSSGVAGLSALGADKDENTVNVNNLIKLSNTTQTLMKCIDSYKATQALNATGNNIIIRNIDMKQAFNGIAKCSLTGEGSMKASSVMAANANQGMTVKEANPLQPFVDVAKTVSSTMKTMVQEFMMPFVLIVVFIGLIIAGVVFTSHRRASPNKYRPPPVAAPPPAATPPQPPST